MFLSELLSRNTKITNNIQQTIEKYNLFSLEAEKKFFKDLRVFGYISNGYINLIQSVNNPDKLLSNKEINFSTLQKFYKGDEVDTNLNSKNLSLKESTKQRTIIQKFESFYKESYKEA